MNQHASLVPNFFSSKWMVLFLAVNSLAPSPFAHATAAECLKTYYQKFRFTLASRPVSTGWVLRVDKLDDSIAEVTRNGTAVKGTIAGRYGHRVRVVEPTFQSRAGFDGDPELPRELLGSEGAHRFGYVKLNERQYTVPSGGELNASIQAFNRANQVDRDVIALGAKEVQGKMNDIDYLKLFAYEGKLPVSAGNGEGLHDALLHFTGFFIPPELVERMRSQIRIRLQIRELLLGYGLPPEDVEQLSNLAHLSQDLDFFAAVVSFKTKPSLIDAHLHQFLEGSIRSNTISHSRSVESLFRGRVDWVKKFHADVYTLLLKEQSKGVDVNEILSYSGAQYYDAVRERIHRIGASAQALLP